MSQFDAFYKKAKELYVSLEALPYNERVAIASLIDQMCEFQCAAEDEAEDRDGDEWKDELVTAGDDE